MAERLQKILAERGLCSRRKAETLIREGRVRLNGAAAHLGDTARPEQDVIEVDGVRLGAAPESVVLKKEKNVKRKVKHIFKLNQQFLIL